MTPAMALPPYAIPISTVTLSSSPGGGEKHLDVSWRPAKAITPATDRISDADSYMRVLLWERHAAHRDKHKVSIGLPPAALFPYTELC